MTSKRKVNSSQYFNLFQSVLLMKFKNCPRVEYEPGSFKRKSEILPRNTILQLFTCQFI